MNYLRNKSPIKSSAGLLLILCFLLLPQTLLAKIVEVSSPDGEITVTVSDDKTPHYRVNFHQQNIIEASRLGMVFKETPGLDSSFTISSIEKNTVNSHWQLPWGERKEVLDSHNELTVNFTSARELSNKYSIRFRIFNDGIGFRYEVPKQKGLLAQVEIIDELTEFNIGQPEQTTAWWIPARGWNRYEYLYNTTSLEKVDRAHTPFTFKLKNEVHVSIHEAALVDYASMTLNQQRPGKLKADLTPWSDGILVKTKTAFKTPWRTIQISKDAVGLLNSALILNLNEPSKIADTSWIKPGKYVGIWWGMHVNETTWASGKKHGATTSETKRYMDFAAEYGFDGVLVEGWNIGWDGDWFFNGDIFNFTKSYADFDLKAITEYGQGLGVKLIGHHETSGSVTNYRNQLDDAYRLYQQHGVSQVKTGYVADGGKIKRIDEQGVERHEWHDGQFTIGEYLHSVKEAAKYQISINTHEPIKDTGLRRTYPNWISREGARGQEFNAWSNPPNGPEHTAMLPFTRMLAGPMDFTPGIFNFDFNANNKQKKGIRPQTTLAKQLALYVVLYSPVQMAADLPRHYKANLPAFQFIRDVPTNWQQSKAIAGEVGDYVVFARQERKGQGQEGADWYLGALTDELARTIEVPLTFLDKNKDYQAQIYRDGEKADWLNNPYDLIIEQKTVTAKDKLLLPLASSGGVAIRFKLME